LSLFQQSNYSFGEAKRWVATQAGKQSTDEMLARAGDSIVAAVQHWNSKANWDWLITTAASISVTSATALYALPYNFKDMYTATLTAGGYPRTLKAKEKRLFTRYNPAPVPTTPFQYDLLYKGGSGLIELLPSSDSTGTLDLVYYRKMVVPCTVTANTRFSSGQSSGSASVTGLRVGNPVFSSAFATGASVLTGINYSGLVVTFNSTASINGTDYGTVYGGDNVPLDIPDHYEMNILAWAAHHFMSSLGVPQDRLGYWIQYAKDGLDDALAEHSAQPEDLDVQIERNDEAKQIWYRNRSTLRWDGR